MLQVAPMTREFNYNGLAFDDPNPSLSPEEIRDALSVTYPELTTASIQGPEAAGGKLRYNFVTALGSKA